MTSRTQRITDRALELYTRQPDDGPEVAFARALVELKGTYSAQSAQLAESIFRRLLTLHTMTDNLP